ncbi:spore coat U domain-containing protein [Rhizobium sp. PL01]|uniref:Csu type fimbrial protein n=1 Tax=Rhizobium sp. PL01 TaxID=3085631 RepID=UPI0029826BC9|nr:spore coat U domain-containing protein [Rhizobium sp. PL01]MDW5316411.1 spore coat U domain-containing protein [Rhizobium sp. PL01]
MKNHRILTSVIGGCALVVFLPWTASSQTATTQFNVQITITGECKINSAANLNFGSVGIISTNLDASSNLVVQCTNGTSYNVGLDAGIGSGATTAVRKMTGPNAETVSYSLYTDAARGIVWGNTIGTNTKAATGSGAAQTYTVYGRVPPQNAPTPGAYADTVTVTLTY